MRFGGIFVGVLMAAGAAFFVLSSEPPAPPPVAPQVAAQPPEIKTVNVFVAKKFIPVGTVIAANMFDVQPWPEHLLVPGFAIADGKTEIAGMVSRAAFQAQEPLIISKLVNANDPSFIAGNLPKGMRVITIQTNEIYGLAGFLAAGDRVDVLLNREVEDKVFLDPDARTAPKRFKITESVLTNTRVIAVDQKAQAASAPESSSFVPTANQPQRYEPPRTVSLMVSPEDARRIRLAESIGTLSLALRSVEDRDEDDPLGLTFVADVSQYTPETVGVAPEEAPAATPPKVNLVTVVRGIAVEDKQTKKRQLDLDEGIASFTGAGSQRR
jgi:pilus assembly protein CpaB